ncbi:MAG: ABC transporter permease subunit [Phycisphaerales bacterium]
MPVILRWLLRFGPTNPITVRLVQNGSRRVRHMWIRSAYLGVMILVLLWALLQFAASPTMNFGDLAIAGTRSFAAIATLQIALICVLAPVFMAGAIAQESDPKTWDILLTTPLSAAQIVLGNLFGRLFFILALLFSSLPLFAITQYYGGVPGTTIFASYAIAACAALVVGTAAIALSVSRLVGRRAVFAFYVTVISYLAVTWAIDAIASPGAVVAGGVSWMTAINPFLTLQALLDPPGYPRAPAGSQTGLAAWFLERPVTTACVLSVGLSLVLMFASSITVRLGGFVAITGTTRSTQTAPWYRKMFGLGAAGSEARPARGVWHNPIAWREAAARNATLGRIVARWLFIAVGAAWAIVVLWFYHAGSFSSAQFRSVLLYTTLGELAVITLVAMNMSATAVSREREDGTLDLLLTTPIGPGQYLSGKLAGIVAYLLPLLCVPLGTLLLAGLYASVGGLGRAGGVLISYTPAGAGGAMEIPVLLPEAGLVAALVSIPFMALCVILGMQWSLKSKGTIGSVMGTVGVVAVIAGPMGLCGWTAAGSLPGVGPMLAALSPASVIFAGVAPEIGMQETVDKGSSGGLAGARVALAIGSVVSAGVFIGAVAMIRASMIRTFDMTVRRLAGIR